MSKQFLTPGEAMLAKCGYVNTSNSGVYIYNHSEGKCLTIDPETLEYNTVGSYLETGGIIDIDFRLHCAIHTRLLELLASELEGDNA